MVDRLGKILKCLDHIETESNRIGHGTIEDCQMLFSYAQKENDEDLLGIAYYHMAMISFYKSSMEEASGNLNHAILYLEQAQNYIYVIKAYNMLGILAYSQGNLVLALSSYRTCLEYSQDHEYKEMIGTAVSNIAGIYFQTRQYKKAEACYQRAIEEAKSGRASYRVQERRLLLYISHGCCLLALKQIKQAEDAVITIRNEMRKYKDSEIPYVSLYHFMAWFSYETGDKRSCREYIDKAIEMLNRIQVDMTNLDWIRNFVHFLIYAKEYYGLEKVLNLIEPQLAISGNEHYLLESVRARMQYCSSGLDENEYLAYAKEFFRLLDKEEYSGKGIMTDLVDLNTKLYMLRENQSEMTEKNRQLLQKSLHDELSGLPNRAYLNEMAEQMFSRASLSEKSFAVSIMDIDFFKEYNDSYGHLEGDNCIRIVAQIIQEVTDDQPNAFAARYGGDEFVILYEDVTTDEVLENARQIKEKLAFCKVQHRGSKVNEYVTISQGIFHKVPNKKYNRIWDYLAWADRALYDVKRDGKSEIKLITNFERIEDI